MSTDVKPKKLSARQKLDLSRLKLTQLELMGDDIDIHHLKLQLRGVMGDITEAITAADVERTIEGASTLTVKVQDQDRLLLRSGNLTARTDVKVDGLWFRLVAINKDGDELTLTFEDREIAVLRTYSKIIKATSSTSRTVITRAAFVLRLIREVKEFQIPWVIPELEQTQPIEEDKQTQTIGQTDGSQRSRGLPRDANKPTYPSPGSPEDVRGMKGKKSRFPSPRSPEDVRGLQEQTLTIKGEPINANQIVVVNKALDTGVSMNCTRPELVMIIMAGIQESSLTNLRGGDLDSVGFLQQRKSQGWPATRNISKDAAAFFRSLKISVKNHPNWEYWQLIQNVQNSGFPTAYAQWRREAEKIVTAYGEAGDVSAANSQQQSFAGQNDYEFYRGIPPSQGLKKWGREDSWHCLGRLADEVNWRAFFVSGTFYYISEPELFKSKPAAVIWEGKQGIDNIDGEYDEGKKNGSLTVTARIGRWACPPGSVVQVKHMGPWDGRWLCSSVKRSLFDSQGTITLKKPRPKLPEPIGDTAGADSSFTAHPADTGDKGSPDPVTAEAKSAADAAKKILHYYDLGMYRDDNGQQIKQLKKIAAGQKLRNQCGHTIRMSAAPLIGILTLLENGMYVGTFALCEDHSCNQGQHPQGEAADISSLGTQLAGWHALNTPSVQGTALAKQAMKLLGPTSWDLICNGVGRYDTSVQALQKDNGHTRGGVWESDHTNHIHYGSRPGRGPEDRG